MFDFFKKPSKQTLSEFWTVPKDIQEIDAVFSDKKGCYIIYKHSYRCSTCIFTMQSLNTYANQFNEITRAYFIDVIAQRPLSNHLAASSGVRHESPQVLLIYQGNLVWYESHSGVRGELVLKKIKELFPT